MAYKTSRVNKQDIRNKVATESRTVIQVPTVTKMYSGRQGLHRHLTVPLGILLLCQDVLVSW